MVIIRTKTTERGPMKQFYWLIVTLYTSTTLCMLEEFKKAIMNNDAHTFSKLAQGLHKPKIKRGALSTKSQSEFETHAQHVDIKILQELVDAKEIAENAKNLWQAHQASLTRIFGGLGCISYGIAQIVTNLVYARKHEEQKQKIAGISMDVINGVGFIGWGGIQIYLGITNTDAKQDKANHEIIKLLVTILEKEEKPELKEINV